jgi:hypothetical protein
MWVHNLSRGGPGGLYWHHEDRVPLHTSFKSRQGSGRASIRCHVCCSFGPHLPAEVGSGATTCHAAPTSKYINNQNSSGQSLKIKDICSPKCEKEKMNLTQTNSLTSFIGTLTSLRVRKARSRRLRVHKPHLSHLIMTCLQSIMYCSRSMMSHLYSPIKLVINVTNSSLSIWT